MQNVHNTSLMPRIFRRWAENLNDGFAWPTSSRLSNAFKYLCNQYIDNVKTNLRTHAKNRLTMFFKFRAYTINTIRMQQGNQILYDNNDIKNAVNYSYNRHDSCRDQNQRDKMEILMEDLRLFGAPDDCNVRDFVANNWFQSLRFWINIQREVEHYNNVYANVRRDWNLFRKHPQYVTRPYLPEPPEIHNFSAIPICSNQRRHIRIDTEVLYSLLAEIGHVPKKVGKTKAKPLVMIKPNEFRANEVGGWGLFFDTSKISAMVKGKKQFNLQIVTDGVSATVIYRRPKRAKPASMKETVRWLLSLGFFYYILGIDPGMRTFNATVRRDLRTGEEVCECNKKCHCSNK